jgi:CRISPR/Cas system-associated protein Cas7 (RAMP superfamily)
MSRVLFLDEIWEVNIINYDSGGMGIVLTKRNIHAEIAADMYEDLVVSVPTNGLKDDEIALSDANENKGIVNCLVKNNIVEEPHRFIYEQYTYGVAELSIVRLKKSTPNLAGVKSSKTVVKSQHNANSAKPAAK